MHYRSLSLGVLCAALAVTACSSADPSVAGAGADYRLINVTPNVVMQMQQQQKQAYSADESKAAPDSSYVYHIGPGDVLYVKLYLPNTDAIIAGLNADNEGWTADGGHVYSEVTVKEDGTITIPLPFNESIRVAGQTLLEAKIVIDATLAKYYKNAQSAIEVKDFKSQKIQVTGDVNKPMQEYLNYTPLHVLEALSNAGGVANTADLTGAIIRHKDGSVEKINLFALINNGDASQNFILHDGDTLNIPTGNKVFIMGAVSKPSMQFIKAGSMTVMEALSNAQGIDGMLGTAGQISGSYKQIYVVRDAAQDAGQNDVAKTAANSSPWKTADMHVQVYHLDCSDGTGLAMAAQFPLKANDVVYVSPTAISEWGRIITELIPINLTSLGEAEILRR